MRLVSVPDSKPTPARIAFSIARGEYCKRYTCRMRSGDETNMRLASLQVNMRYTTASFLRPYKPTCPVTKNWAVRRAENEANSGRVRTSLVPRPHPLTRRNGLVNQVDFLGLAHTFATM